MRHQFHRWSAFLSAAILTAGTVIASGCTVWLAPDDDVGESPLDTRTLDVRTPTEPSQSPEGEPGANPEGEPDGEPGPSPDGEPGCVTDADFFAEQVAPILNNCTGCHVEDGLAGHTRMVLQPSGDAEALVANYGALQALGTLEMVSDPLYIQKPTLQLPHTGGQLFSTDSVEAAALREMTHRFRQPGACEDPGAQLCSDLETFVQPTVRRLSPSELQRTLEDIFPSTDLPTLLFVAPETRNFFDNQSLSTANSSLATQYDHINAQAIAQQVTTNLAPYLPCDASEGATCGQAFVQQMGRRLFRRPLTTEEEDLFASFFSTGPVSDDFTLAAEIALQTMLSSPAFLYRLEFGSDPLAPSTTLSPFETATRLSYFLWGTAPDDALLDAAETGTLSTPAGLESEVDRMLADDKATDGLVNLFRFWLDTRAVENAQKPEELGFDAEVRESLVEETDRFLRDVVLGDTPTLETLLTSNETFVDEHIAPLYNLPAPESGWERVTHVEPRFGVLTQGGFLASRGHADQPSPIRRSVYILTRLMCFDIGSPPPEAEGAEVEVVGAQTNRQATDALTLNGGCRGCHAIINPLGYSLERYGTTGAMRETDNGLPIDDNGAFALYAFEGAEGLANTLNASPLVTKCVAERFSQYALGHSLLSGECFVDDVESAFAASGNNFFALVRAIATHPAFAFGTLDKSYAPSVQ